MKGKYYFFTAAFFLSVSSLLIASNVYAGGGANRQNNKLINVFSAVDMMESEVIFINVDTDVMIQQDLSGLSGWPGGRPQHTLIRADGQTVFVSTDASESAPASIVEIKIKSYDWKSASAKLKIKRVYTAAEAGTASTFPVPAQVSDLQPIAAWTQPAMTQLHGPSILPFSNFIYFTQWTDNQIRVIDTKKGSLSRKVDPIVMPGITEQTHGVFFNRSGTLGLSTGYYYDNSDIDLFSVNKKTGSLELLQSIRLGNDNEYAAFTHFNTWVDERFALTASMQFGPTSLTPEGVGIIPPSVWLIDAFSGEAEKILDTVYEINGNGVLRSPSDINVGAGKLLLAEEDTLDGSYGDDGFISIFDFTDRKHPQLIKRLSAGVELPADYTVSHGIAVTPDERFAYALSYASAYIIKINLHTDEVEKIYGPQDGLVMPHGGFASGAYR